jgi:hypothetical protein
MHTILKKKKLFQANFNAYHIKKKVYFKSKVYFKIGSLFNEKHSLKK